MHVYTTNVDGQGVSDVPRCVPVERDGVRVTYFEHQYLRRLYLSPQMKEALARNVGGFDVVHLHSIFLWPTFAAARSAVRQGVRYVIAPRGMLVKELIRKRSRWIKYAWMCLVERRNLERAAFLHMTSELERREALRLGYKLPPIHVIPNGVELPQESLGDNSDVEPAHGCEHTSPMVLFLGRISWKKGLNQLIPAMKYVDTGYLVVAGNDDENYRRSMEKLAAEHGVDNKILFQGPVEGQKKAALLRDARVLVLPSYSENFGNVVLEAMSVGCPVIVTPKVGLAEIVRDSKVGVVCGGEPHELGCTINSLLQNPERADIMGARGKVIARQQFDWKVVAEKMVYAYTEAVNGSNHDAR